MLCYVVFVFVFVFVIVLCCVVLCCVVVWCVMLCYVMLCCVMLHARPGPVGRGSRRVRPGGACWEGVPTGPGPSGGGDGSWPGPSRARARREGVPTGLSRAGARWDGVPTGSGRTGARREEIPTVLGGVLTSTLGGGLDVSPVARGAVGRGSRRKPVGMVSTRPAPDDHQPVGRARTVG